MEEKKSQSTLKRNKPIQSVIPRLMLAQRGLGLPQSQQKLLPGILSSCSHILDQIISVFNVSAANM